MAFGFWLDEVVGGGGGCVWREGGERRRGWVSGKCVGVGGGLGGRGRILVLWFFLSGEKVADRKRRE